MQAYVFSLKIANFNHKLFCEIFMSPEQEKKLEIAIAKLNNLIKVIEGIKQDIDAIKQENYQEFSSTTETEKTSTSEIPKEETKQTEESQTEKVFEEESIETPTPEEEAKESTSIFEMFKKEDNAKEEKEEPIEEFATNFETKEVPKQEKKVKDNSLEEFIGGNLLSKIGIVLLLIGIGIFVKYAIDNDWITPLGRVLLSYGVGGVLIGISYYLRKKYRAYSAVLMAGGVATIYLTTYLGFIFYEIPPNKTLAFALMLLTTIYTVFEAIRYKQESIGVFGLVAAYAVPFLLSDGSGDVLTLFIYMSIINIGILSVSFWQNWSITGIIAFAVSWIIFLSWSILTYLPESQFTVAFIFNIIFFITFLSIFLLNQFYEKGTLEEFKILLNTGIFYFIGIGLILSISKDPEFWAVFSVKNTNIALFTFINAILHLGLGIFLMQQEKVPKTTSTILQLLGISFLTLSVPLHFGVTYTTAFWSIEAVVLLVFARVYKTSFYENSSKVLVFLAILSMFIKWLSVYNTGLKSEFSLLINPAFFNTAIVILSLVALISVNQYFKIEKQNSFISAVVLGIVIILYMGIFLEISAYYNFIEYQTAQETLENGNTYTRYNPSLSIFRFIALIIFTAIYSALLNVAYYFLRKTEVQSLLNVLGLLSDIVSKGVYLLIGIIALVELRDLYIDASLSSEKVIFDVSNWYLNIRFLLYFALLLSSIAQLWTLSEGTFKVSQKTKVYSLIFNVLILIILTYELNNFIIMSNYSSQEIINENRNFAQRTYTILWGLYALGMISYGIWKTRKLLRFTGIGILAISLLKLFLFDLSYASTLQKIIVFISIALILLLISYLYQRFKDIILADDKD